MVETRNQQPFVFVTYTGRPADAAKKSSTLVRQHVVHRYLNQQQPKQPKTKQPPTSKRRRLTTVKKEPAAIRDSSSLSPSSATAVSHATASVRYASFSTSSSSPRSVESESECESKVIVLTDGIRHDSAAVVETPLSGHLFDPFDALPVKGGITWVDHLTRWHFLNPYEKSNPAHRKQPWLNGLHTAFKHSFWALAGKHEATFHVLLCNAAAKMVDVTKARDSKTRELEFYHRGQALRLLRKHIADHSEQTGIVRNMLAIVASGQATLCMRDDDYAAARIHLAAVQWLVANTPGYHFFNLDAIRHMIWADLRLASSTLRPPMLPYDASRAAITIPPEIVRRANRSTSATLELCRQFFYDTGLAYDLIMRLHQISMTFDTPDANIRAVVDVLYSTEYRLTTLVSNTYAIDQDPTVFWTPSETLTLALHLYTWACIQIFAPATSVQVCLVGPLYRALLLQSQRKDVDDLVAFWRAHSGLEALIWILFVASASTLTMTKGPETGEIHAWTIQQLGLVLAALDIRHMDAFVALLRQFPWVNHFCSRRVGRLGKILGLTGSGEAGLAFYDWDLTDVP